MERLQAAIEKARAQRKEGQGQPAEELQPSGAARMAVAAEAPDTMPDREALWSSLAPLDTSGPMYAKGDLVAFRPGTYSSAYDMLRTRMLQQATANGWRRIAIVSSHAGSGKTTTIANLAFSLGRQTDLRTMVLDLDLRRATLAQTLGQTSATGSMADVLEGRSSFAEHGLRHGDNLAFGLNAGRVTNPAELLHSQRARSAIDAIDAAWQPDLLLFDMPPLLAADDSYGLLKLVDCALLIVAAEETPMSQIDLAERQIAEITQVMGVVLNKCRIASDAYGYDYSGY